MDTMVFWSKNQESEHKNDQRSYKIGVRILAREDFLLCYFNRISHLSTDITSVSEKEKYYGLYYLSAETWRADREEW